MLKNLLCKIHFQKSKKKVNIVASLLSRRDNDSWQDVRVQFENPLHTFLHKVFQSMVK